MVHVFIGSDHAGFELKNVIVEHLSAFHAQDIQLTDLGCSSSQSVDYPDFADLVCHAIGTHSQSIGILICGSGQGMVMRANKYSHIRAALVYREEIAVLAREHNDANVICFGARFISRELATTCVDLFLRTRFLGDRHTQRVAKLSKPTA